MYCCVYAHLNLKTCVLSICTAESQTCSFVMCVCIAEFANVLLCTVCMHYMRYLKLQAFVLCVLNISVIWIPELPEPKITGNLGSAIFLADKISVPVFTIRITHKPN